MQLVTYLRAGNEEFGILKGGAILPLTGVAGVGDDVVSLVSSAAHLEAAREALAAADGGGIIALDDVELLAPVPRPGKIFGAAYNYRGHTSTPGEDNAPAPDLFMKLTSSVAGAGQDVIIPAESEHVDYEPELGVIIGKPAWRVSREEALDYVAGYTVFNDVSARDWQHATTQWNLAKSFPGFSHMGPALVTADEVGDVSNLRITIVRDGVTKVDNTTAAMVHPVDELIAYISTVTPLEPGDIIATGSPARKPEFDPEPRLESGDSTVITIEHVGRLTTRYAAPRT
ncbi:fumarylacetoacetate hydrolase family protein [Actinomyces sp. MRS3W]|uniref:fumarylacetoacetate hydrolase family protein n=1 Tax=Actinomyces sp. MRS3W TaxID=2800796 RepID=UPI0028FD0400|nr:fumarylacetoacetate hydrolase family protein [Actinomyces sp. MRS3W]MDU0347650.1 fumarylacetoacetate hydrolase family protein [Actinomyces sp. MRS3W]